MNILEQSLATLVAMPTISDDCMANQKAVHLVGDFFAALGMHVEYKEYKSHPALYASAQPGNKTPKIMIVSHIDVMSGDESLFNLRKADGNYYGRGVFDMKFAIAASMELINRLKPNLSMYDIGFAITSDEEYGNVDGVNSIRPMVEEGYVPQVALVFDGGDNWGIERLAKGHWRFELIAQGKTAHGSRPWEGESASFKLVQALHELKQHFNDHGPLTDTLNIGIIKGGQAINQVPEHMSAAVEIRLVSPESYEQNKQRLAKICAKYDVTIQTRAQESPQINLIDHPLVDAFTESVRVITGTQPGTCVSFGGSDAKYFNKLGLPTIVTRPPGGGLHGPGEWISASALHQLPDILQHYVQSVAMLPPATQVTRKSLALQT